MSLLDDWQAISTSSFRSQEEKLEIDHKPDESVLSSPAAPSVSLVPSGPSFRLSKLPFAPTLQQGSIQHVATSNNIILISFSKQCSVLRWNLDQDTMDEVVISQKADDKIYKVFIDPSGQHSFVSLYNGNVYYVNSKWKKCHSMSKMKGIVIDSMAFLPSSMISATSTGYFLIGTTRGAIYECLVDDKDKDRQFRKLFDLSECGSADLSLSVTISQDSAAQSKVRGASSTALSIAGLHIDTFSDDPVAPVAASSGSESSAGSNRAVVVLVATPTRLYQFVGRLTGAGEFGPVFQRYASNPSFQELPCWCFFITIFWVVKFPHGLIFLFSHPQQTSLESAILTSIALLVVTLDTSIG